MPGILKKNKGFDIIYGKPENDFPMQMEVFMNPILGNIIVIAILAVPVFFAGRYCFRDIKSSLSGGPCGGCSGDCSSCGSGCSSCSSGGGTRGKDKKENSGPKRYAINGKIVTIPGKEE